jgi:hypothetical protein
MKEEFEPEQAVSGQMPLESVDLPAAVFRS